MASERQTVLISRGDVESLVLALILVEERDGCEQPGGVTRVRHMAPPGPVLERRLHCARMQADLLGVELEVVDPGTTSISELAILLDGIESASPEGVLAWPVRCGPDAEAIALTMARAEHLRQAHALQEGGVQVELLTPLIDLDPQQVLGMALELGAPLQAGWPCDGGEAPPCGQCVSCAIWSEAAMKLGSDWPWHAPAPA